MKKPRFTRYAFALATAFATVLTFASSAAQAVGSLADITVIDRASGEVLPVYWHNGRHYVSGRPGTRYAIRVHNRQGGRVMAVMAVDGVNIVSGETAAWDQRGYVFSPWQQADIAGWRKSQAEIAAFEFTSLGDSYAARTGRPNDVGVIGVALFREQPPVVLPSPPVSPPMTPRSETMRDRADSSAARTGEPPAQPSPARPAAAPQPSASPPPAAPAPGAAESSSARAASPENATQSASSSDGVHRRMAPEASPKLGTGHGAREHSISRTTHFTRAQSSPDEVVTIHYDSRENLVALGVIPAPRPWRDPQPRPFPGNSTTGFVADPR